MDTQSPNRLTVKGKPTVFYLAAMRDRIDLINPLDATCLAPQCRHAM